ncbi:MAG: hypothetical protein M1834_003536 [Cirrosporium novae-zelandiae]|nr:MAG: hypothetical protein M1834_003536 [Cirrosporium novae-zelandiae]
MTLCHHCEANIFNVSITLRGFDDVHAFVINNLAENDVLAIELGCYDDGDEELRPVTNGRGLITESPTIVDYGQL